MKRGHLIGALALLAIVVAAWQLWPTEERRIRERLEALVTVVNDRPSPEGVGMVARTVQLTHFFEEGVVVDAGTGAQPLRGRERLVALASRMDQFDGDATLSLEDVSVEVSGAAATSHVTAILSSNPRQTGDETIDVREAELRWTKAGEWRIAAIRLFAPPK